MQGLLEGAPGKAGMHQIAVAFRMPFAYDCFRPPPSMADPIAPTLPAQIAAKKAGQTITSYEPALFISPSVL
jgi:hypothetical protein